MSKLLFGVFLIIVSIAETIHSFAHHFIFTYYDFSFDDSGKRYLAAIVILLAGIYLTYKAGESKGKEYLGFDDFDEGC